MGDIPVPMIRNGQHMSTAFKMDEERYPWHRSSAASDRFYDDFDLKFKYLKQDSLNKLLFYYSVLPESPQRVEKDIYSARIKPSGDNKYEKINNYLSRVAKQKAEKNFIDNAFVYTGHGYISQSLAAWADERISLKEQFPKLFTPGGKIKNLFFEMSRDMKEKLLAEIQNKELDMAIFHAHGDEDMQLILDYPSAQNTQDNIESVKMFLRSKMRSAKNAEDTKTYFMKEYDVPESWFEGAFTDSVIKADSLMAYKLDIYIKDVREISPQAKFIVFDECFNGSFQQNEYIAGEYVFGKGNVVVAEGNSVNVLQDKWADEFLGLLNFGLRIGNLHKLKNHYESHLIGDPTYHFASDDKINLNEIFINDDDNLKLWDKYLTSGSAELRSLAVRKIFNVAGREYEKELVQLYLNDESVNVRLHALKCLATLNSDAFREIPKISINDPYEFIRRKSADWMGEIGDPSYLPLLAKTVLSDESERTAYNAKSSMEFYDSQQAYMEIERAIDEMPQVISKEKLKSSYKAAFKRSNQWLNDELIPNIFSDTLKLKSKLSEIRTFRNYRFINGIPHLIKLAADKNADVKVRTYIVEALGWYNFSLQKNNILSLCENIIADNSNPAELIDEAVRTKNRILTGSNDVMIP